MIVVIEQKIHTHLIIINLHKAIKNQRLRNHGVGVYLVGVGVYNFQTLGVGA